MPRPTAPAAKRFLRARYSIDVPCAHKLGPHRAVPEACGGTRNPSPALTRSLRSYAGLWEPIRGMHGFVPGSGPLPARSSEASSVPRGPVSWLACNQCGRSRLHTRAMSLEILACMDRAAPAVTTCRRHRQSRKRARMRRSVECLSASAVQRLFLFDCFFFFFLFAAPPAPGVEPCDACSACARKCAQQTQLR